MAARPPVYSRLILLAASSIDVHLTSADGTVVLGDTLPARPSGGTLSTTFTNLPLGAAILSATAYPNADGSGVALASAQAPLTLTAGQAATVPLTMASTIKILTVTPATSSLTTGQTVALTATATDASGNVVLFTSSALTWLSSAAGIATVDVTGNVTAIAASTATIIAKETESGVSGTSAIRDIRDNGINTLKFPGPKGSVYEAFRVTQA